MGPAIRTMATRCAVVGLLTTDNYECTLGIVQIDPVVAGTPGQDRVRRDDRIHDTDQRAHSQARLVDRNRAIVDVSSIGFSMADRVEPAQAHDPRANSELATDPISDWAVAGILHDQVLVYVGHHLRLSALAQRRVEFKQLLHRFVKEFSRIETLAGVKRTVCSINTTLAGSPRCRPGCPEKGVNFQNDCFVTTSIFARSPSRRHGDQVQARRPKRDPRPSRLMPDDPGCSSRTAR